MSSTLIGGELGPRTRIFISYRRQDTAATAAHLHASLARRFGSDRVFRDVVTIEPGRDFAADIERSIQNTTAFIVLIGRRWLTIKNRDGIRRLDAPDDFVRLEVESGLRHAPLVIPVLVDGAEMPGPEELPPSIAELAQRNAHRLSWHEEVGAIGRQVALVERERAAREAAEQAERNRLDLTRGGARAVRSWRSRTAAASFNVVLRAMEISLEQRGHAVRLSARDFAKSMEEAGGRPLDQGFLFADMLRVIDFVGIRASRGSARYVARSYPVASLDDARSQLELGRPVLTGVTVTQDWFSEPASTTGRVERADGPTLGGAVGAIVAWDPGPQELHLLTPWPTWGDGGEAILTRAVAERCLLTTDLRSVEPVAMPARDGD